MAEVWVTEREDPGSNGSDKSPRPRPSVEASEARLRALVDATSNLVWFTNAAGQIVEDMPSWRAFTGLSRENLREHRAWQAIHPDDRTPLAQVWGEAVGRKTFFEHVCRLRRANGSYAEMLFRGTPVLDADGEVREWFGTGVDVTEARLTERRQRFLSEASTLLASSLDVQLTLTRVAQLAVPGLADWCGIDMLEADGGIHQLAVAHVDPDKVKQAHELRRRYPPDPAGTTGVPRVLRTGKTEWVAVVPDEALVQEAKDPEQLALWRALGLTSVILAPLVARGRAIGVITLVSAESGRQYTEADVRLAEDLATRAAVAVDNARLFRDVELADRRKNEFLAMLGHELRNPLAPIVTALHLLRHKSGGTLEREIAVIDRQSQLLTRLVDDLLDVSRISRGKIELTLATLKISEVLSRAMELAHPLLEARGQRLETRLDAGLWVEGDSLRLAQVVANLLTNAAKYSPHGNAIALAAAREGDEVVIRVSDTGQGIAPELLPFVFELFVQGDRSLDRSQGGLGIGLTLVRELVALHGGSAQAKSGGVGKGAEVTVRLPAKKPPETPIVSRPPPRRGQARKRILVVDDNADAAELLAEALADCGHEVSTAQDGLAALAMAEKVNPEVILLDIGLPGMDGFEVARTLRNQPAFARTRLIALTGYGQDSDRAKAMAAGFDLHLVKPIDLDTLLAALEASGRRGEREPG